jgi:hypothetical protein
MDGKTKHVMGILLRIILVALISAGIMAAGVILLLNGVWWAGVLTIIFGAVLLAIPVALCLTPLLCNKLYGPSESMKASDSMHDAHRHPQLQPTCSTCRAWHAWILALFQGVYLPPWEIMSMQSRGTPPNIILNAYVMTRKSQTDTTIAALEDLYITEHSRIHDEFDLVHMITGIID